MTCKAFLVGINRYPDPRNNLKGCVNAALLMAKTLREQLGRSFLSFLAHGRPFR